MAMAIGAHVKHSKQPLTGPTVPIRELSLCRIAATGRPFEEFKDGRGVGVKHLGTYYAVIANAVDADLWSVDTSFQSRHRRHDAETPHTLSRPVTPEPPVERASPAP